MRFSSWSIRAYLTLALGTVVLAIGLSGAIEWWSIAHVRSLVASVQHGDVALAESVGSLRDDVLQLRRYEKDVFINIGSAEALRGYRSKWDGAFRRLRFDLVHTRTLAPQSASPQLQQFTEAMGQYRSVFEQTYDLIQSGALGTARQANEKMADAKAAAHRAERQLVDVEHGAQARMSRFDDPALNAQWLSVGMNLLLLLAVGGPLAVAARRQPHAV